MSATSSACKHNRGYAPQHTVEEMYQAKVEINTIHEACKDEILKLRQLVRSQQQAFEDVAMSKCNDSSDS